MSPVRLHAAVARVGRRYPGPVGDTLARELLTWAEFGYRLGGSVLMERIVDHVLRTPYPRAEAAS